MYLELCDVIFWWCFCDNSQGILENYTLLRHAPCPKVMFNPKMHEVIGLNMSFGQDICTSILEVNIVENKIMMFGCNKKNNRHFTYTRNKLRSPINTNTLELMFIHLVNFGHLDKERSGSWCHMFGTQFSRIQGFSASYFHIWHRNLGRWLEILSFKSHQEGNEDANDVSVKVHSLTTYHILLVIALPFG